MSVLDLIDLELPAFPFRVAWHICPRYSTFPYAKLVTASEGTLLNTITHDSVLYTVAANKLRRDHLRCLQ